MDMRIFKTLIILLSQGCFANAQAADLSQYQDAANKTSEVWKFPEYVMACTKIDGIVKGAQADLQLVQQFDKTLGWVGPALGLTEATLMATRGNYGEAAQKVGATGLDYGICVNAPNVCPAWAAGRTVGEVVNGAVSIMRNDGKDVTGLLEDLYIYVAIDAPATRREILKLEEAIAIAKKRRESRLKSVRSCSDPLQTRAGVDKLLSAWTARDMTVRRTEMAPSSSECSILKDTTATESLSRRDPDSYDALLAKCL